MDKRFRDLYLAEPRPSRLEVRGVVRDVSDPDPEARRALVVCFNREPSNDELRAFHEHVRLLFPPHTEGGE